MSISTHFSPDVGTVPGLEIWRIENFAPVQYKKQLYGTFYSGDAYLVLCTIQKGSKLKWDVHFWLGENASQDEIGTAALLAVELDNHLGGVPVQHREVQGHESSLFSSYFSAGIRYLDGGVASGFRKVSDEQYEKKLLQIKGKRNVRVVQVPLHVSSMNKGDCFVLDTEKTIYVYVGQGSKRTERLKAIQAANQVRDQDHAGKAQIFILDEYADVKQFSIYFEELGSGSPSEVPEAKEDDDAAFEESQSKAPALFHVSDASGALVVRKIGEKPLQQTMLDKKDCFILDTAGSGLFVWVGSQCTSNEKSQAMIIAEKYLKENGYPKWTRVHRVVDGGEPTIFRQYFASWKDKDEAGLPIPLPVSTLKRDQLGEFDVKSLHREKLRLLLKQGGAAPGFYPDDGSGQKEIYRVENFELKAIHESACGMFFGGDSYVIKYTYDGGRRYIVYFWQGNESSHDEKAASAIHAANMDNNQLGGMAVQVRVTQGNEPRHFIKMFQGRMIIFSGGRASGFRNVHDYDSYDVDGTRLFHVCGSAIDDMRAVQVPEKASFLNSNDVFVLETPSKTFIWYGSASSQEEKDLGIEVSNMVSPDHATETIAEGEEPEEFWNALGGKEPYTTEPPEVAPALKTRLFHCTLSSLGRLRVEEIKSFKQEDLVEDDIMVLDSGIEIYVWVGRLATDAEREAGWRMAQEYLRTEPSPRTADSSIIVLVPQGKEPDSFKIAFPNWDDDMWKDQQTWEQIRENVMASFGED